MKATIFSGNRLILVHDHHLGAESLIDSAFDKHYSVEFNCLEDLRKKCGDDWYRCLKVGFIRNPYDLAVTVHFWFQQTIAPKSLTLAASLKDPRWKKAYTEILECMSLMEYDSAIRYEQFQTDVVTIKEQFGLRLLDADLSDDTRPNDTIGNYRSLYDSRTRSTITRMSKKIISDCGYAF